MKDVPSPVPRPRALSEQLLNKNFHLVYCGDNCLRANHFAHKVTSCRRLTAWRAAQPEVWTRTSPYFFPGFPRSSWLIWGQRNPSGHPGGPEVTRAGHTSPRVCAVRPLVSWTRRLEAPGPCSRELVGPVPGRGTGTWCPERGSCSPDVRPASGGQGAGESRAPRGGEASAPAARVPLCRELLS